jgi:ethanolamine utilization protein EutP
MKVMIIGAIGSGKSTLTQALLGSKDDVKKTQSLNYQDWIVDTPGEYSENPLYYKAIMATSLEVSHVILVQDATKAHTIFPPGFALGIANKTPIGVVTKTDHPQANAGRAEQLLRKALPPNGKVLFTSAQEGQGMDELLIALGKAKLEQQHFID